MNIEIFQKELEKIGIFLSEKQFHQLEKFYQLLIEWNEKMNLTRITDKEEVYLKHFYDSLTIYKVIDLAQEITLCDVGSGAGFPGIVLKIAFPNLKVTLLDALQKRVNYLNEIIKDLDLQDIQAYHTRAEDYAKNNREKFDIVTARAVANLADLSELCIPMVKKDGYFVAMKANALEEIETSKEIIPLLGGKIVKVEHFELPIEESTRTLIQVQKINVTNSKYPRRKRKQAD